MKRLIAISVLLLSCSSASASATQSVITCTDYTPYHQDSNGKLVFNGRNIETLFYVVSALSFQLDASIRAPFVRCLKLLEQGKIDVLAGLIHTEERAQLFKLIPYRDKAPLAIFYRKDDYPEFDLKWLGKNEVIGMHRAFALPDEIKNSELENRLTPITSVGVGFEMLIEKRLSGVLATVNTGQLILDEWPEIQKKIAYKVIPEQGDGAVYFAIHPDSPLAKREVDIRQVLDLMTDAPEFKHLGL